jgi:hypothetical protein
MECWQLFRLSGSRFTDLPQFLWRGIDDDFRISESSLPEKAVYAMNLYVGIWKTAKMVIECHANCFNALLTFRPIHKREYGYGSGHVGFQIWVNFECSPEGGLSLRSGSSLFCRRGTPEKDETAKCEM